MRQHTARPRETSRNTHLSALALAVDPSSGRLELSRGRLTVKGRGGDLTVPGSITTHGDVVGTERFELSTPCSQSRCATKLRHVPVMSARDSESLPPGATGALGERAAGDSTG